MRKLLLLLLMSTCANAEVPFALEVGAGGAKGDDSETVALYKVTLGLKRYKDVYLWSTYDSPEVRMLGQELATPDILGFGVGFQKEVAHGLRAFVEGGWADLSYTLNEEAAHEVVYTQLIKNHQSEHRPIPVQEMTGRSGGYPINFLC